MHEKYRLQISGSTFKECKLKILHLFEAFLAKTGYLFFALYNHSLEYIERKTPKGQSQPVNA